MRWFVVGFAALCLVMTGAGSSKAQTSKLLPEAQKAFDRGLAAVAQQDWSLAARYFTDAQKLGGYDQRLYLNLALANAKAGRELLAIAWFNAFLALAPNAPNAAAVRAEIARQKETIRAKIEKILASAQGLGRTVDRPQELSKAADILRGPAARIETLIALRDYDNAALSLEGICEDPARHQALFEAVRDLMAQSDRAYRPEEKRPDIEHAGKFLDRLPNSPGKANWSAALRAVRLKQMLDDTFDLHVMEELYQLQTDAGERNALLLRAARAMLGDMKFPAIEPLLRRMETRPGKDVELAAFLTGLAFKYLETGRDAEARATAQRVLSLPKPTVQYEAERLNQYRAAAKAVLGDITETLAIEKSLRNRPYPVWQGAKNLVGFYQSGFELLGISDFSVGAVTFTLTMRGKGDEAMKLAQRFAPTANNTVAFTNIAYAYLLRDNAAQALAVLKALPKSDKYDRSAVSHLPAQLAGLYAQNRIKHKDFKGAEQALAVIPPYELWKTDGAWTVAAQYRVEILLLIAEGAQKAGNATAAQKYVADARRVISDARANADLQRDKPDMLNNLLERVASTHEAIGDKNGAQAARADSTEPPSRPVRLWLDRINHPDFAQSWVLNPEQRLAEIAKDRPEYAPGSILSLAEMLATQLRRLELLEGQTTQPAPARVAEPCKPTAKVTAEALKVMSYPGETGARGSHPSLSFASAHEIVANHAKGIALWDLSTGSMRNFVGMRLERQTRLLPGTRIVATGSGDAIGKCHSQPNGLLKCDLTITILDLETGKALHKFEFAGGFNDIRASANGKWVVRENLTCGEPNKPCRTDLDVIDVSLGKLVRQQTVHGGDIVFLPSRPNGAVFWSRENSSFWDFATGNREKFQVPCHQQVFMGTTPDGRLAFCRDLFSNTLEVRSFRTGIIEKKLTFDGELTDIRSSSDGRRFFVLTKKGRPVLRIIDADKLRTLSSWGPTGDPDNDPRSPIAFAPDDSKMAWFGKDGLVVLNIETQR